MGCVPQRKNKNAIDISMNCKNEELSVHLPKDSFQETNSDKKRSSSSYEIKKFVSDEEIKPKSWKLSMTKDIKILNDHIITLQKACVEDKYEIVCKVGQGTYGSVFKVKHKENGLIRAMKIIKKKLKTNQSNGEQTFLKEIDILIQAHHPNILSIFEYYIDDDFYYIITEFIEGHQLFTTIINNKKLSEEIAAIIFSQLISAIKYLHSKNIVHRDLKPENIIVQNPITNDLDLNDLQSQYSIKIIDFGASINYKKDHHLKLKTGSPYYIAPEVIKRCYNEKCDIWSCGVILYILLSGAPPFNGKNQNEIMNNVLLGTYNINNKHLQGVSSEARDLISKMLTYDYNERISADDVCNSQWLNNFRLKNLNKRNTSEFTNVVDNIIHFNAKDKFQQATLSYLVYVQNRNEETEKLKKLFYILDKDGSGRISYDSLKSGIEKILGKFISRTEFNLLLEDIDVDQNGFIEYNEFLCTCLNKRKLLTEENLKIAFNNFDQDKKGFITEEEIKKILGTEEDDYFQELKEKIEIKNEEQLSFSEFKELMGLILSKEQ